MEETHRKEYEETGKLTLPGLIEPRELKELKAAAAELVATPSPQRIVESDGETVRTVFGPHLLSPVFDRLMRNERVVAAAGELLGEEVYLMQSQFNPKPGFDSVAWNWHSDYLFWHTRDGMSRPRALTATVYLDDVTTTNGPIMVIPGSHREPLTRVAEAGEQLACGAKGANADPSRPALRRLAERHGIELLTGAAGSVLFFHGQVLHCSSANQSPFDRAVVIIRYNSVDNPLPDMDKARPEWKIRRHR